MGLVSKIKKFVKSDAAAIINPAAIIGTRSAQKAASSATAGINPAEQAKEAKKEEKKMKELSGRQRSEIDQKSMRQAELLAQKARKKTGRVGSYGSTLGLSNSLGG